MGGRYPRHQDNANSNSKWSYNASTKTLTLKSYTYSGKGYAGRFYSADDEDYRYFNAPIYWSDTKPLTINMTGTNKVTATYIADSEYEPAGIFAKENVIFKGTGTLTAVGAAKSEGASIGVHSFAGDVTLESGTLNAAGAADGDSFGIYAARRVFVNSGTLNASGGSLYEPEDESISTGICSEYLVITGGTVSTTGGNAGKYTSAGFCSLLRMKGGTLTAKGGTAGLVSAGAYFDGIDSQIIAGGTATFTGGSCSKGSYGLYNLDTDEYPADPDVDPAADPGADPDQAEMLGHMVHYSAKVTAAGNTAASNLTFDYDYDDDMFLDYLDDDEGGSFVVIGDEDEETGDTEEEETIEKVGSYYIYSKRYAPVIKAGNSVSGTGTVRYVAPDPALDIYTNRKYVNITPAKLPTSIQLSNHNYQQTSTGGTMQPTVTYTPADADIKAVNWSSTNESIATVSSTGLIKVVASETGIADIYARVGNCYDVCRVSYFKPQQATPNITIAYDGSEPVIRTKEGTLKLHATVTPASYASELTWVTSDDNEVATFDKNTGIVTGHANGNKWIYARLSGHPSVMAAINITVSIPEDQGCDHPYVYDYVNLPATFEQDGYKQKLCFNCNETWGGEVIPSVSTVQLLQTEYEYDGQPKEPEVIIKDRTGKDLERASDYELEYYDNVAPGIGRVRVALNGYYNDVCDLYFTITCEHDVETLLSPASGEHGGSLIYKCKSCGMELAVNMIPRIGTMELSESVFEYTGEPIEPEVIVKEEYGYTLDEGEDYDVTYQNNVRPGHGTARVEFKGWYESVYELDFEILPQEFDGSLLQLNKKSISYSKNPVLPKVVAGGDYDMDDFSVKYVDPANKNVGVHSLIVTSPIYNVDKELTYVIKPVGTKLKAAAPGRKTITVKWRKQASKMAKSRITGYQVQYSTDKKFRKTSKIKTVKGFKKTSKKITRLKSGKTYYLRIRTYMKTGDGVYYSKWSKVRKAKVK